MSLEMTISPEHLRSKSVRKFEEDSASASAKAMKQELMNLTAKASDKRVCRVIMHARGSYMRIVVPTGNG